MITFTRNGDYFFRTAHYNRSKRSLYFNCRKSSASKRACSMHQLHCPVPVREPAICISCIALGNEIWRCRRTTCKFISSAAPSERKIQFCDVWGIGGIIFNLRRNTLYPLSAIIFSHWTFKFSYEDELTPFLMHPTFECIIHSKVHYTRKEMMSYLLMNELNVCPFAGDEFFRVMLYHAYTILLILLLLLKY